MVNEINSQKPPIKIEQPTKGSKAISTQTAKPSVAPALRSAASLAASAGLPADKLSASIVSFVRFFSLPLKPQVLADIRRQALMTQTAPQQASVTQGVTQGVTQSAAQTSAQAALQFLSGAREATALCAAAAESKGVELSQKGLESYTEAVDPDSQKDRDEQQKKRDNKKNEQKENTEPITADNLKKMALEYTEKNPLLDILNKLPGKNGQRWIVIPFDFSKDEKDFKVSMRILLDERKTVNRAACMALDILESSGHRQVFVMEASSDKLSRLTVYNQYELPPKHQSKIKNELSQIFKIPVNHVFIVCSAGSFPYEASYAQDFSPIDEAV